MGTLTIATFKEILRQRLESAETTYKTCRDEGQEAFADMWFGALDTLRDIKVLADRLA